MGIQRPELSLVSWWRKAGKIPGEKRTWQEPRLRGEGSHMFSETEGHLHHHRPLTSQEDTGWKATSEAVGRPQASSWWAL